MALSISLRGIIRWQAILHCSRVINTSSGHNGLTPNANQCGSMCEQISRRAGHIIGVYLPTSKINCCLLHPTPKESIHFPSDYSKCRACNWLEGQPIRVLQQSSLSFWQNTFIFYTTSCTWPRFGVLAHRISKCILFFRVECI